MQYNSYEEAAITIQHLYEEELDETNTLEELTEIATECVEAELPESNSDATSNIVNEIIKLYEATS